MPRLDRDGRTGLATGSRWMKWGWAAGGRELCHICTAGHAAKWAPRLLLLPSGLPAAEGRL